MRYLTLLFAALVFAGPFCVRAADLPVPQSVQEPDAPDDDADGMMPPEEEVLQGAPQPTKAIKPDVKPPEAEGEEGSNNYDKVVLQGLNKVTARAQTIEAPIGSVVRFGTIEITAHSCWKSAPDERPENAALLEISEIKQNEGPAQIFLGWMFSSSPGLSGLENPFYDVTVVACEKAQPKPAAVEPLPKAKTKAHP